jgi:hypothetical protein
MFGSGGQYYRRGAAYRRRVGSRLAVASAQLGLGDFFQHRTIRVIGVCSKSASASFHSGTQCSLRHRRLHFGRQVERGTQILAIKPSENRAELREKTNVRTVFGAIIPRRRVQNPDAVWD